MNNLSSMNLKKVLEQNFEYHLNINKNEKKRNKLAREKLKCKVFYEAQHQLYFTIPKCELEKLTLNQLKQLTTNNLLNSGVEQKKITEKLKISPRKLAIPSNADQSSSTDNNSEILAKKNDLDDSGYCTLDVNENKQEHDDYIELVESVFSSPNPVEENKTNLSNCDVKSENQCLELKFDQIRRSERSRKPVLYCEDLTHIQFSKSPKISFNCISSPTNCTTPSKDKYSETLVTDKTILPEHSMSTELQIDTTGNLVHNDFLSINKLPKNAKSSHIEINMPRSFKNSIGSTPVSIKINLENIDVSVLFEEGNLQKNKKVEEEETAAAVASITADFHPIEFVKPTVQIPKKIRKPRISKKKKSDLAKFIESFGNGNSNIVNDNNEEAKISGASTTTTTTTGDFSTIDPSVMSVLMKDNNGAWTFQTMQHSNATLYNDQGQKIKDSGTFTTNQMEEDLEENGLFNIINYIENETISLPVENINKIQVPSKSITMLNSSPRAITSTTSDFNNTFYHQIAPPIPPQPIIKNHFEQSLMSKNYSSTQNDLSSSYHLINNALPFAHSSSQIFHHKIENNGLNVLDLSKKELIVEKSQSPNINNEKFPKKRKLTFENDEHSVKSKTKIIVKGHDMPLLFEDIDNLSCKSVELQKQTIDKNKSNKLTETITSGSCQKISKKISLNKNIKYNKNEHNNEIENTVHSVQNVKISTNMNEQKYENLSLTNNIDDTCVNNFLSMTDNTELDYEIDDDLDCLQLYSSPYHELDLDENIKQSTEIKINSNKTNDIDIANKISSKFVQNSNMTYDTDIFGIIRKVENNLTCPMKTTEQKDSENKNLKDFKIPKKVVNNNIQLLTNNNVNSDNTQNKVLDFGNNETIFTAQQPLRYWPNNPTNIIKPTRQTIPSTATSTDDSIVVGYNENRRQITSCISQVFGSPCFNFLQDMCFETKCHFKHTLIDNKSMKMRLGVLSDQYIQSSYYFVMRHYKLFRKYFELFCEIFAEKRNIEMLTKFVIFDYQKFENFDHLIKPVLNALVKVGINKIDAIKKICHEFKGNSVSSINCLIDIIVDTDPLQFLSILEYYAKSLHYKFQMEIVNKLTTIFHQTKNYDLLQILLYVANRIPNDELRSKCNDQLIPALEQFFEINAKKNIENNTPQPLMQILIPSTIVRTVQQDNIKMTNQQNQNQQQTFF